MNQINAKSLKVRVVVERLNLRSRMSIVLKARFGSKHRICSTDGLGPKQSFASLGSHGFLQMLTGPYYDEGARLTDEEVRVQHTLFGLPAAPYLRVNATRLPLASSFV